MEATLTSPPLLDQVQGALSNSPHVPSHQVRVETTDGHVRIQGTVGSFFQKQMAQEVVLRLDGVQRIENQLEVCWT
jgi:osmotically-inducible protein OsmY